MEADENNEVHIPLTLYQQEDGNTVLISPQNLDRQPETQAENQIIFITPDTSQSPEVSDDSVTRDSATDQIYAYLTDDGQGNFTLVNEHSYNKVPSNSSGESDSILAPNNCPVYLISEDGQATPLENAEPVVQSTDGQGDGQNVVVMELPSQVGESGASCQTSNFEQSSQSSGNSGESSTTNLASYSTTVSECLKRKQNSKSPKKIVRLCNLSKQTAPTTVMTTHTEPELEVETLLDTADSQDSNSRFPLSGYSQSCSDDNLDSSGYFSKNVTCQSYMDYDVSQTGMNFTLHRRAVPSNLCHTPKNTHPPLALNVERLGGSEMAKLPTPRVKLILNNSMGHTIVRDQVILTHTSSKSQTPAFSTGPLYTSTPVVSDMHTPKRTSQNLKNISSIQSLLTTPTSTRGSVKNPGSLVSDRLVGEPAVARRSILSMPTSATHIAVNQLEGMDIQEVATNSAAVKAPCSKKEGKDFDPGPTDDSLTNIQWLGKMSGQNLSLKDSEASKARSSTPQSRTHSPITQIIATEQQIEKVGRECGVKKRPPYSYMHLIQMAISSRHDKRMTLREIYQWIEVKFPYYKYSTKQGWKNSIRHNLSLYDIFVREKPHIAGKSGSSYWTLRNDLKNKNSKTIRYTALDPSREKRDQGHAFMQLISAPASSTSQIIQVAPPTPTTPIVRDGSSQPSTKPRKGPTPLLPKLAPLQPPPPLQAYALIPIPAGMPVVAPPSMVVSSWPAQHHPSSSNIQPINTSNSSFISFNSSIGSNNSSITLKRSYSQDMDTEPFKKQVKIAPKASILDKSSSRRRRTSSLLTSSADTYDIQKQLSRMKFDSGVASDMSTCDSPSLINVSNTSSLLPPKPNRHKRSRKDKPVLLRDCDEEDSLQSVEEKKPDIKENMQPVATQSKDSLEILATRLPDSEPVLHISLNESVLSESGFHELLLATLDSDLPSPAGALMSTPPKPGSQTHSPSSAHVGTPLSPWISPIKNITALTDENRPLEGFFTPNGKLATSTPNGGKCKSRNQRSSNGLIVKSPRIGSLRDLGLPGLTPLKTSQRSPNTHSTDEGSPNTSLISNRSFQRLLGDFHLDSMMDQVDDSLDIANFSLFQC